MQSSQLLIGTVALASLAFAAQAQERSSRTERDRDRSQHAMRLFSRDDESDRAALGISTMSSGKRDTLGLLIASVTPGGPAERAGLEEGNRIAAVNGVSLKLAPADAGEPDMNGLMTRRLIRQLRKVKPGDEVELKVYANGAYKTVKVKTVELGDLGPRWFRRLGEDDQDRAVVGLNFGGGGSKRDTLGIFVVSVAPDGPAEKAGIVEGNRVAAINGVDLRVPADEAADGDLSWAKQSRFNRELRKVKPGDTVELKVYANGQMKTVRIKMASAAEVYGERSRRGFHFNIFGDEVFAPLPPIPPIPPIPPLHLELGEEGMVIDMPREAIDAALEQRVGARELRDAASRVPTVRPLVRAVSRASFASADGRDYTLSLPGLRLTKLDDDLASYFGAGSDEGLLVLEAEEPWSDLHAGDVILTVNGEKVRRGADASVSLDPREDNEFEVLRKGKRVKVVVTGK